MAQASKAILPKDVNGPWGKRINVTVGGGSNWALRVGAYETARNNASDWLRYSIVVLNWYVDARYTDPNILTCILLSRDDSSSTTWNPQPVKATIEFRGMQVRAVLPARD